MNRIRINKIIDAYSKALELDPVVISCLNELLPKIIEKYEKSIPYITVSQDDRETYPIKPVNGVYSVEDFFLNRLLSNVWSVDYLTQRDIDEGFVDKHTKGFFTPEFKGISLNKGAINKQMEGFRKNYSVTSFDKIQKSARKKVIMHEFEHALQTGYAKEGLDVSTRGKFKKILDSIQQVDNGEFAKKNGIKTYEEIPKRLICNNYTHTGVHCAYSEEKKGKTYRNVKGFDLLNEIFNESESLEMSEHDSELRYVFFKSKNYMNLANPESSNCLITPFAEKLKILLGNKNTFEGMYLNPVKMFEIFNRRFNSIFQQEYGNNLDAMENVITSLYNIKTSQDCEQEYIKLEGTLLKCFSLMVDKELNDANAKQIKDVYLKYTNNVLNNEDVNKRKSLPYYETIKDIKNKISNPPKKEIKPQEKPHESDLKRTGENSGYNRNASRTEKVIYLKKQISNAKNLQEKEFFINELRKVIESEPFTISNSVWQKLSKDERLTLLRKNFMDAKLVNSSRLMDYYSNAILSLKGESKSIERSTSL